MNSKNIKTLEIRSILDEVKIVGQSCRTIAESLPFNDTQIFEIELAVVEAVTNCITHAYKLQPDNSVRISFEVTEDSFVIEIEDSGSTWDNFHSLLSKSSPFDFDITEIDQLPEGGMGVALISSLMDDVSYNRDNDRNVFRIAKRIEK